MAGRRIALAICIAFLAGASRAEGETQSGSFPEICHLEPELSEIPPASRDAVTRSWGGALEVAVQMREQVAREAGLAKKSRRSKLAAMQSRIVATQQSIFIALGPDRHALSKRLSKRLEACVARIQKPGD